jgi:WD40 repeat protein
MKFFPHLKRITKILQLDRETILTCSQDSKIKMTFLVKTHLNSEIPEMSHTGQVNDMSLFDNDFKLVSVCSQGFIKIWDLSSRHSSIPEYHRPLNERRTKNIFYSCAVIKKSRILTGTSSGTVQLWNMDLEILVEKSKHVGPVYCIQVSFDENEFLTAGGEVQGGKDYFIRKWKISTNLKNFDCKESFNGHVNSVNALLWTEDGFFSASSDKSLKVFKDKKQENFPGHNGEIRSVFVSIDGQFVVSADSDDVFIWSSVSRSLEVRAFGLRAQINCVTSKKKLIFLAFLDKSVLGYDMVKKSKCFLFRDCSRIINKMMVTNDLKYLVAADDYQVAYFKIKKNQMDFNCSCTEKNNSMSDLYPETIIMFR